MPIHAQFDSGFADEPNEAPAEEPKASSPPTDPIVVTPSAADDSDSDVDSMSIQLLP